MSIRLSYSENNSDASISSFTDYQNFILSVAATNVILNKAIDGTDTIDFIKNAVDEKEDAKKQWITLSTMYQTWTIWVILSLA
ncbi:hypothetical protein R5O32_12050 [Listeria monocytogenes]|nr:hypothetical protein R5O32_12050 [Listeria monocytogenes]WOX34140.1 hypothetical protein R5O28_10130 [Listeria monocytogenes]